MTSDIKPAWHPHTVTVSNYPKLTTKSDIKPGVTSTHRNTVSNYPTLTTKSDVKPSVTFTHRNTVSKWPTLTTKSNAWHPNTGTVSKYPTLTINQMSNQRDIHTPEHSLQVPNTYHKSDVKPSVTLTHRNTVSKDLTLTINQMSNPGWHSHTGTQSPTIRHLPLNQMSNPAWHSHTETQSPTIQHLAWIRCQTQHDIHTPEHSLQVPNTYHKSDVKPSVTFTHWNTVSKDPTLTINQMSNPGWHSHTGTQSPTIQHLPLNQMSNPGWHSHTGTHSPSTQHLP